MKSKTSSLRRFTAIILAMFLSVALVVTNPIEVDAASAKTGIGMAEFGLNAYRTGWQYNYGSWGQLNSSGQRMSDCSGLIYAYLCWDDARNNPVANYSWPRGATSQYIYCSETGTMDTLPRTHGVLLFYKTSANSTNCDHVGIYVGNDKSVDNSDYNVNMRYLTASTYSKWTAWGKLKNVEYPTNGWYEFDGSPYFYVDGEYVINTSLTIDGTTYTFNSAGKPSPTPAGYSDGSGTVSGGSSSTVSGEKMITTAGVNVRSSASLSGNVLRVVPKGTTVTVTDKSNSEWYAVALSNGTRGYIFSQYLSADGSSNTSSGEKVNLTGTVSTGLNLRSQASTGSSVKKVLGKGTSLIITEKLTDWYKVKLADGTEGYVYAQYVNVGGSSSSSEGGVSINAQTTADVNVRDSASMSGKVLTVLDTGTAVTITDRSNSSWYKVSLSNKTVGYIYSSYLKEGGSENSAQTPAAPSEPSTGASSGSAVTTTGVNLRSDRSTSSSVICVVNGGTSVTVTDTSSKDWFGVKLANGTTGYIYAKYLKLEMPAKTTTDVNLRSAATTSSAVTKVVANGTDITIISMTSSDWFRVQLADGTTGYMASAYISY